MTSASGEFHSTWTVSGMTCGHCVMSVTEELEQVDDITAVVVDLASGRVELDSTRPIGRDEVAAAVDEAGYTLKV
jgi:copper chaperone CopZ